MSRETFIALALAVYSIALTVILGVLMYSVISTREFEKGYSTCLRQAMYELNDMKRR